MSLPNNQWNNNEQDGGLGAASLFDDVSIGRPGSPFSLSDVLHPLPRRQISIETIVSTPPILPLAYHHHTTDHLPSVHPAEDHNTFRFLQQLKAGLGGATESHKENGGSGGDSGSLFSVHSAPPVPLTDAVVDSRSREQSRPVSLALDPNAMLSVQFAAPVAAAHSSNAVMPDVSVTGQSDEADDEENENLWTVSSACSARPLIAKSRELRFNSRAVGKSKNGKNGGGKSGGSGGGGDDGTTSVGGVSKGSDCHALDGGYGWLVVFGAFSVNFWVAGLVKSYGVLHVEIMEIFPNASAAVASWIPAILSALCLVLAPVSSGLSQRFSCRLVVFIGGLFCALGLILSYFATNLVHLFFTFGVLNGIGGGLSTTPGIIIVSQYFDKRRALANGLCVSGTAAGSFVFPMLIDRLIRSFGFHGTILILGGCMLHVCISAVLYRSPVSDVETPLATDDVDTTNSSRSGHLKSVDTTQTLISQNSSVLGTYLSASAEEPLNSCNMGNGKKIFIENLFLEEAKNRLNDLCQDNGKLAHELPLKPDISDDEGKDFMGETIVMKPFAKCMRSSSVYLHSVEDLSTDSTFVYKKRGSGHESNRGSRRRNKPTVAQTAPDGPEKLPMTTTIDHLVEKKDSIVSTATVPEEDLTQLHNLVDPPEVTTVNHLPAQIHRGLSKSMMIIPTPLTTAEEDFYKYGEKGKVADEDDDEDENEVDDCGKSESGCVSWINNYLDLSLLSDPLFILMCLSVTLMSTGSPYMLYYLPAHVLSAGYTKSDAGYLVAVSAAFDLTGRLGFGYLSDLQLFDRRKAFVMCILGAGLAVLLLSVAESSLYSLGTAVGTYGFCVGSWYLLMPVLLADVFGLERISSSYGLIRMFQGVGAISVPPLTGFLRDLTGSYEACFYSMGACMMLGSIPLIVSIVLSNRDNETDDGGGEDEEKSESKLRIKRSP